MFEKINFRALAALSLTTIIVGGALVSCKTRKNDPPIANQENLDIAIQQAVDNSIIRKVSSFADNAAALDLSALGFCLALDENALLTLQNQWRLTQESWFQLAVYNFGPTNDNLVFPEYTFIDSLRLRGTNYLQTVRNNIADDVTSTETLDANHFSTKTFQFLGLLPIESAIFETALRGNLQDTPAIIQEFQLENRKCEVLLGLTNQLLERAENIQEDWLDGFNSTGIPYRQLLLNDQLDDGTPPLTIILVTAQEYLDYLKRRNVVALTAPLSDHGWQSLAAAINEVESLLQGSSSTSLSFFALMSSSGNENAVAAVRSNISDTRQAINDRDETFLQIALGRLDGNFKREIPKSLDVELGINFSDGD